MLPLKGKTKSQKEENSSLYRETKIACSQVLLLVEKREIAKYDIGGQWELKPQPHPGDTCEAFR